MRQDRGAQTVAVIGAGSWGTALANLLAKKGHTVRMWSFELDVADTINTSHENVKYMKGIALAPTLTASTSLEAVVTGADAILSISPAQHVRGVMADVAKYIAPGTLVISASKGIELGTLKTMAHIFSEVLPSDIADSAVYLSGPSFALEVARELPTAVTIAGTQAQAAERGQDLFQTPYFRAYTSDDVIGIELGGALKNVIAVAAGMGVGLGLGHNATAALITRGLAEISRLGVKLGANPLTLAGLSGMGDLILTCTGDLSRNRHVGVELGRGRPIDEILAEMVMVAEGVQTSRAAYMLAQKHDIEMPIVKEVYAVIFEGRTAREAVE
ncbi:MAG: NAD(P)H-dependent glycerol-3-phosphate dehydrogenase, partial [Longimicrobiales bacterium]